MIWQDTMLRVWLIAMGTIIVLVVMGVWAGGGKAK